MKKMYWMMGVTVLATACGGNNLDKSDTGSDNVGTTDMGTEDTGDDPIDTGNNTTQDMGGPVDAGVDMASADMGGMDAGGADAGMDMGGDMGGPCDRNGFTIAETNILYDTPNDQFLASAFTADPTTDPYELFSFEIYPYLGGTVGAQNFTFTGQNYADCNTCLVVFGDCAAGGSCDKSFLVQSGSVEVTAASTTANEAFSATFTDLVLDEVTIDPNTYEATPVADGETWCVDSLQMTGTTEVIE